MVVPTHWEHIHFFSYLTNNASCQLIAPPVVSAVCKVHVVVFYGVYDGRVVLGKQGCAISPTHKRMESVEHCIPCLDVRPLPVFHPTTLIARV